MIGWEHFDLYLGNKIFPNIGFVQERIKEQIQWKLMTKFFFKLKKPFFRLFPKILEQIIFSKNFGPAMHNFIRVFSTMPKFREI